MPKPRTAPERVVECAASQCGNTFTVRGARRVAAADGGSRLCCSAKCRHDLAWVTRPCAGCGDPVVRRRSDVERQANPERAVCNPCLDGGMSTRERTGSIEPCGTCGKFTYRPPSHKGPRYCTTTCWGRAIEGERVERVERACVACGTIMRLTPDQRRQDVQTCSRECTSKARRQSEGERTIDTKGYAWVTASDGRRMFEHRLVMEQHLGRPLREDETVHHKTGGFAGRSNNALSNLELWTGRHPAGHRVEDVVAYAREMLALYGSDEERSRYSVLAG